MLLKERSYPANFVGAQHDTKTSPGDRKGQASKKPNLPYVANAERMSVHVVAEIAQARAAVARKIFAAGHHAEVYADASEVLEHRPSSGVILVEEAGKFGARAMCHALSEAGLWLPVIGFGEQVDAERIVAGMKAGAMDFLVGTLSVGVIAQKLKECAEEARTISEDRHRKARAKSLISRLSERERQVLGYMAEGLSNKEIARELDISPRTVEIHRMKMMGKLGASSSAHAVRMQLDTQ